MIKLIGIAVVAAGFALRLNTLHVVLLAGFATGWVAGMSPQEMLRLLGELFTENRFMTLPIVLLMPVVGLLERYGLQERAAALIRRASTATAGRVMLSYQVLREGSSMVGLSLGGHASMVRPLVAPMAEAAARARVAGLPAAVVARLRAHAAAAENWGNFFADDVIVAVGPVLLMSGVFAAAGVAVPVWQLGLWGLPTALMAIVLGGWRYRALDRAIARAGGRPAAGAPGAGDGATGGRA